MREELKLERSADLRYRGQSFELTVRANGLEHLHENFTAAHRRRYGFELSDEEVQVVNVRAAAIVPVQKPDIRPLVQKRGGPPLTRRSYFTVGWVDVPVYSRDEQLGSNEVISGPAIIQLPDATCVVQPGWQARVDAVGALILERS